MLDNVEAETRMVAFFTEALLRNSAAFAGAQSYSSAGQPHDPVAASYSLAPRVTMAAAKPELDLTSNLDKLFVLIKQGDPILEAIYYGMQSGVSRRRMLCNSPSIGHLRRRCTKGARFPNRYGAH
jgi:hypothetical protein